MISGSANVSSNAATRMPISRRLPPARLRAGSLPPPDRLLRIHRPARHHLPRRNRRRRSRHPRSRGRGVKIFGETCTQYLFLTADDLDKPDGQGAKWVCSPPLRTEADQEALWHALAMGDLQLVSSDHAPYTLDEKGKYVDGPNPSFKKTANGMPGLETRLPMLFDAMVSKGRYGINKFVAWTATEPARMYGLGDRKGTLAIGADADIAIWDPNKQVTLSDDLVHDNTGYTPYRAAP